VTLGGRPTREDFTFPDLPGLHRPALLGVQTQTLTPELKIRLKVEVDAGAVVTAVVPNSPAVRGGLRQADVIAAIEDQPVMGPTHLHDAVRKAGPGKEITLQVVRETAAR
jgi:serine protease Do